MAELVKGGTWAGAVSASATARPSTSSRRRCSAGRGVTRARMSSGLRRGGGSVRGPRDLPGEEGEVPPGSRHVGTDGGDESGRQVPGQADRGLQEAPTEQPQLQQQG